MTAPKNQSDLSKIVALLERSIGKTSGDEAVGWLRSTKAEIQSDAPDWKFYTAFSGAPQHVGKRDLDLSEKDLNEADRLRTGWRPRHWSTDQAARSVIVLSYPSDDRERYVHAVEQLFSTADVRESVALYQLLPLLPYPDAYRARAAEGIRSNMTSVFNAVAHHNPYPSEYLDEPAWNQMVLKALFVGSPLSPITGLDDRTNPELARMLVDYARERWAAQRDVSPELWRPVGPYANEYLEELGLVLSSPDETEREAAGLALAAAGTREAESLLGKYPELAAAIRDGDLTWQSFAERRMPG